MLIEANDPRTVSVMALIQHLNMQELKDLLNEDSRLEYIIKDSQMVKQQESEKDVLLASNKSLAEYNLKFEPKINSNKAKLIELYQSASELDSVVQEKEKKMDKQGDNMTPETAVVLIQSSASQTEEESDQLAEKFLDRTLDVDTFIEEFQNRRKTAHLRKVKAEKMKELIAKQKQSSSGGPPARPAPLPPGYLSQQPPAPLFSAPSSLPYPMGGASGAAASSLPYPMFPPNQSASGGMPYPVFPNANIYPPPRY